METLYRKVAVSERLPNDSGYYFGIDSLGHREYPYFDKEENKWESIWDTTHWLEEIPNPTAQLKTDKEELLKALEKATDLLESGFPEISAVKDFQSLIQKHKQ